MLLLGGLLCVGRTSPLAVGQHTLRSGLPVRSGPFLGTLLRRPSSRGGGVEVSFPNVLANVARSVRSR